MGKIRHCVEGKCVSSSVDFNSSECGSGEVLRCAKYASGSGKSEEKSNVMNGGS